MRQKYTSVLLKKDDKVIGMARAAEMTTKYRIENGKLKTQIVLDNVMTKDQFYDVFDIYVVTKEVEVALAKDEHSHDVIDKIIDTWEICFKDCYVVGSRTKYCVDNVFCENKIILECFDSKERGQIK
jgi:hypothetical protein